MPGSGDQYIPPKEKPEDPDDEAIRSIIDKLFDDVPEGQRDMYDHLRNIPTRDPERPPAP